MNDIGYIFKESDAEVFMNMGSYSERHSDAYCRIQYKMLSRYTIKTGKTKQNYVFKVYELNRRG